MEGSADLYKISNGSDDQTGSLNSFRDSLAYNQDV